jgi:hypothetical protein
MARREEPKIGRQVRLRPARAGLAGHSWVVRLVAAEDGRVDFDFHEPVLREYSLDEIETITG